MSEILNNHYTIVTNANSIPINNYELKVITNPNYMIVHDFYKFKLSLAEKVTTVYNEAMIYFKFVNHDIDNKIYLNNIETLFRYPFKINEYMSYVDFLNKILDFTLYLNNTDYQIDTIVDYFTNNKDEIISDFRSQDKFVLLNGALIGDVVITYLDKKVLEWT